MYSTKTTYRCQSPFIIVAYHAYNDNLIFLSLQISSKYYHDMHYNSSSTHLRYPKNVATSADTISTFIISFIISSLATNVPLQNTFF